MLDSPSLQSVPLESLAPDEASIALFLRECVKDNIQLVAITPGGPTNGRWFDDDVTAAVQWAMQQNANGKNIYWSVNIVRAGLNSKASKTDIVEARYLHVDVDPPKIGDAWDKDTTRERLRAEKPSFIIDSGGGLQGFWRLEEPSLDFVKVEARNKQVCALLSGDSSCWNIDRIMRLPGTINYPNKKKRDAGRVEVMAALVEHDSLAIYDLGSMVVTGKESPPRPPQSDPQPGRVPGDKASSGGEARVLALAETSANLRRRLAGDTSGLTDTTGSGVGDSVGQILVHAGFSRAEMEAALRVLPVTTEWATKRADARQLDRIFKRGCEGTKQEEWPEVVPLSTGLPPVDPFTPDLLPETLRPWVMDIAERMQCPPDFPAVAAIVTLSAVVGRQIGIRPKQHDDWLVIPNVWGAVVGRPSVMKSPAMTEAKTMISRLSKDARRKHEEATEDYNFALKLRAVVEEVTDKAAKDAVKAALKSGEDAGVAMKAAMDRLPAAPEKPFYRRYETNDPTVEKLGELLNETPRGLLVFRDELVGLLNTMDRAGHEADRAFYLESWEGRGRFTYDRIGRGTIEVEALCLSILGGIQPGPLQDYISQATNGGAGDDGLLQRMQLIVWPDVSKDWNHVDRIPDTPASDAVYEVYMRLDNITPNIGEEVKWIQFDVGGQLAFNEWRSELEHRLRPGEMPEAVESHLAKYRSLMPSLALLFHLIDTPEADHVRIEHVNRAIAWCRYLETHARRLYSQKLNPSMTAAVRLAKRLKDLSSEFTARTVSQKNWQGLDRDAVERALPVLEDFGYLKSREPEKTKASGRPTTRYLKNPNIPVEG
jgi:hypothetical protein